MNDQSLFFETKWGKYSLVTTGDGSLTVKNENVGEACHSSKGALTETLCYYIQGCEIRERAGLFKPFQLMEIGFGFGQAYRLTCRELSHQPNPPSLFYLGLERDASLIEWGQKLEAQENFKVHEQRERKDFYPQLKDLEPGTFCNLPCLRAKGQRGEVVALIGEAREVLKELWKVREQFSFQALYQDAFSPQRNPELWTVEWFYALKHFCHPEVILSTFSSSSAVRKGLLQAGWIPAFAEGFAGKDASTRARLQGELAPEMLAKIGRSTKEVLREQEQDLYPFFIP